MRKTIIIKDLTGRAPTELVSVPEDYPSHKVVERVQRQWARWRLDQRPPSVSWKVVDGGLVDAMIASVE